MTKPTWIKHYIGMAKDPKFADIIGEHCFKGTAVFWMFIAILEATAHSGGVFAMSSEVPHSKFSLRGEFALLIGCVDDDFIQWALDLLVSKEILTVDLLKIYKVKNFEKYQHESLSTDRVTKHRNKEKHEGMVTEVIQFLNATKTMLSISNSKGYNVKTPAYRKNIGARLDDGYSMEDFRRVITYKASKWQGTEWEKFIRPATLFIPGNFDTYLNEVPDNWDTNLAGKKMLKVETMSGQKKSISQAQYDRAEPGYFTIIT